MIKKQINFDFILVLRIRFLKNLVTSAIKRTKTYWIDFFKL